MLCLAVDEASTTLPGGLTNWALVTLAGLVTAGFIYLKSQISQRDGTVEKSEAKADKSVDRMVEIMQRVIEKSDERYDQQKAETNRLAAEHGKDRDAFMENTGRHTHALEQVTVALEKVGSGLTEVREELKRSNPSISTRREDG